MLTTGELLRAVLLPAIVALAVAMIARWRRWSWALPLVIGIGFVAGWFAFAGMPSLPPRDGTDWLFWLTGYTIPVAVVVFAENRWNARSLVVWLGVMATCVGLTALGVALPLARAGTISIAGLFVVALAFSAGAAALAFVSRIAAARVGVVALFCVMSLTAGATGVVIFASHIRVVGIYGLSAAAAIGGTAVALIGMSGLSTFAITATELFAAAVVAGLLSGGHYYAESGISWGTATMLFALPDLVLIGALLPTRRKWVRSLVGVFVVGIAAAAIAAPLAIKAKKAAEQDPYAGYLNPAGG
jgi:hypothetical protein